LKAGRHFRSYMPACVVRNLSQSKSRKKHKRHCDIDCDPPPCLTAYAKALSRWLITSMFAQHSCISKRAQPPRLQACSLYHWFARLNETRQISLRQDFRVKLKYKLFDSFIKKSNNGHGKVVVACVQSTVNLVSELVRYCIIFPISACMLMEIALTWNFCIISQRPRTNQHEAESQYRKTRLTILDQIVTPTYSMSLAY